MFEVQQKLCNSPKMETKKRDIRTLLVRGHYTVGVILYLHESYLFYAKPNTIAQTRALYSWQEKSPLQLATLQEIKSNISCTYISAVTKRRAAP